MENTHTLLCKKVAQLTKVIYNLNCRYEDRDLDINLLTKTYETELDYVSRNLQYKFQQFQDATKAKVYFSYGELYKAQAEVKQLNLEKNQFIEKFSQFKQQSDVKLAYIKQYSRAKVEQLISEVDAIRKDSAATLQHNRTQAQSEFEVYKKKMIVENSQLYTSIYSLERQLRDAEQRAEQEKSRADEYEGLKKQAIYSRAETLQAAEKKYGEYEAYFKALQASEKKAQENLSKMLDALEKAKNENSVLQQEIDRFKKLHDTLSAAKSSYEQEHIYLKAENQGLKAEADRLKVELEGMIATNQQLKSSLSAADQHIYALTRELADLQNNLEQNRAQLGSTSENERKLQLALDNARKEASYFMEQMGKHYKLNDEQEALIYHQKEQITVMSKQISQLERYIAQLRAEGYAASAYIAEYAEYKTNLERTIASLNLYVKYLSEQLALSTQSGAYAEQAKSARIAELQGQLEQLSTELKDKTAELLVMKERSYKSLQQQESRIGDLEAQIADFQQQLREANASLDEKDLSLKHMLNSVSKRVAGELSGIKASLFELQAGFSAYVATIDFAYLAESLQTSAYAAFRKVYDSSFGQVSSVEKRLNETISELQQGIQQAEAETARLGRQLASKDAELAYLTNQLLDANYKQKQQSAYISELKAIVDAGLAKIRQLETNGGSQSEQLKNLQTELDDWRLQVSYLNDYIQQLNGQISSLRVQQENELREGSERHKRQIFALEKSSEQIRNDSELAFRYERDKYEAALLDKATELERLREYLAYRESAEKQARDEILQLKSAAEALNRKIYQLTCEIGELKQAASGEVSELQKYVKSRYDSIGKLKEEITAKNTQINTVFATLSEKEAEIKRLKEQLAGTEVTSASRMEYLKMQHEQALKQQYEDFLRKLEQNALDAYAQLAEARAELEAAASRHESEVTAYLDRIARMQEKFDYRPPRYEDLDRIAKLVELLQIKEQELRNIGQQTEWYKRQLLDREEAYNKRFHKDTARVGTMEIPGVPVQPVKKNASFQNSSSEGTQGQGLQSFTKSNGPTPQRPPKGRQSGLPTIVKY